MKKYCDYYYTVRVEEVSSRNNSAVIKRYSWTVREKDGTKIYSSMDNDGVFPMLYDSKFEAESDCRESIQDHYL